MSQFNTLKVYKELMNNGMTSEQATAHVAGLEEAAKGLTQWLREAKKDFASNKLVSIFGTVIIAIGSFTLVKMWDLSHDMIEVKTRLTVLEQKINK